MDLRNDNLTGDQRGLTQQQVQMLQTQLSTISPLETILNVYFLMSRCIGYNSNFDKIDI